MGRMDRRRLEFQFYDDVISELERLKNSECEQLGNWKLGDICFHLNFYFSGSLDGFPFKLPWIIRTFIGKPALWWRLRNDYPPGSMTVPKSVPSGDVDENTVLNETVTLLRRLNEARKLHPSSLFGDLTIDQWKSLHLQHAAHHLSFLFPKHLAPE
jgi:hypothetical protein